MLAFLLRTPRARGLCVAGATDGHLSSWNKSNKWPDLPPTPSPGLTLTGPLALCRQVTGRFSLYHDVMLPGWQVGQRWMEVDARLMLGTQAFVSASLSFLSFSSLVGRVTQSTGATWTQPSWCGEWPLSLYKLTWPCGFPSP